jgi:hypothetical protein
MAVLTTALMAGFMPGASPPDVSTPMVFMWMAVTGGSKRHANDLPTREKINATLATSAPVAEFLSRGMCRECHKEALASDRRLR